MNLSLFLVKIDCLEPHSLFYIVFMGKSASIYIISNEAGGIRTIYNITLGIVYIYVYIYLFIYIYLHVCSTIYE